MDQLHEFKKASRAMWALGDYDELARTEGLYVVGERLVGHAAVGPSDRVLDVACGTGNVAVPAARTGAVVTGIDLAPEMLESASRRAAQGPCARALRRDGPRPGPGPRGGPVACVSIGLDARYLRGGLRRWVAEGRRLDPVSGDLAPHG